jgi:hypothetical protein
MAVTDHSVVETVADTFNAHDLERLSALLREDVMFRAPRGIEGEGRAASVELMFDRLLMLEQLGLAPDTESGP